MLEYLEKKYWKKSWKSFWEEFLEKFSKNSPKGPVEMNGGSAGGNLESILREMIKIYCRRMEWIFEEIPVVDSSNISWEIPGRSPENSWMIYYYF